MKMLLFGKPYKIYVNQSNPCCECILDRDGGCSKISAVFCIKYGGFASSDTKIFTL
jgi:hypothetical protein